MRRGAARAVGEAATIDAQLTHIQTDMAELKLALMRLEGRTTRFEWITGVVGLGVLALLGEAFL